MLFNSYEFIFILFPLALLGNRLLEARESARIAWLLACSLFFYGWWNPAYLPLLLGSIGFNFVVGRCLCDRPSRTLLIVGIAANLGLIAYFKYAHFLAGTFFSATGVSFALEAIALPLAISFFTFQQIAYLADAYKGGCPRYSLSEYALFVSFFPQLIAGPIVHHAEIMPQISANVRAKDRDVAVGVTIFLVGLFKKTVLADGIAPYANALFDDPSAWESPSMIYAWMGTLAYGLQIYFDFSGYSDMAIGAARIFGLRLPMNFFAPYRALTISDFWRRWHITLSRFLRDYLYIPLGGNRFGTALRYRNLMLTMLLGGLWHGAGWTFVLWGGLHGLYLVVQHGWSRLSHSWAIKELTVYRFVACAATLVAVHLAWVFFRAESIDCATGIVKGLVGANGVSVPSAIANRTGIDLTSFGLETDNASGSAFTMSLLYLVSGFAIIWVLPTTQQFVSRFEPTFDYSADLYESFKGSGFGYHIPIHWRPSIRYAVVIAVLAGAGILTLPEISEFLYFRF